MPETEAQEETTVEYWQKPPHNCTPREAAAQVEKFKQQQDEQNSARQDVTA